MYPAVLPDGSPGGWGFADTDAAPEDLMQVQHLCEREVLWAISIPGESPFVAKVSVLVPVGAVLTQLSSCSTGQRRPG